MDETKAYNLEEIQRENIKSVIKEVYDVLEERGYNALNQIVGYLMSGDLGFISSHKDARKKIAGFERNTLIAELLKEYLKWGI